MKNKAIFRFKPFSRKQRQTLNWWCDTSPVKKANGIIADGAIRSGKTISMSLSFSLWAMERFNGENFAMCGKTISSFRRNVWRWQKLMLRSRGYSVKEHRTENLIIISHGGIENYFYIFGGKDEGSQDLIQGITLAGVFFDEVALMPESFVNQATARCSVEGSKFWFNCNPANPQHWFKREWIDKREEKGLLYLHFTMDDNLSLSEVIKQRYRAQFKGVFFKRYILGLWVAAEGVIYPDFANNAEPFLLDAPPDDIILGVCGLDFGGNGSAHAAALVGITRGYKSIVVLEEYYRKEIIDPETLIDDVCAFAQRCKSRYKVTDIYCDNAETTLVKGIRTAVSRRKIPISVHNARKGEIIDRIRFCSIMMAQGRFFVMRHCKHTIDALSSCVWDSKSVTKDKRLDDGSYNIDSLDALEYALEPYMSDLIEVRR